MTILGAATAQVCVVPSSSVNVPMAGGGEGGGGDGVGHGLYSTGFQQTPWPGASPDVPLQRNCERQGGKQTIMPGMATHAAAACAGQAIHTAAF